MADAVGRELVEFVGHDLHHGRADITDAFTPAEHCRFSCVRADHPQLRGFGQIQYALRAVACGRGQSMLAAKAEKSRNTPWEATMPDTVEKSTASKVYWRLLPLTILTYFLCYLIMGLQFRWQALIAVVILIGHWALFVGYYIAGLRQNYLVDLANMRLSRVNDSVMQFSNGTTNQQLNSKQPA